MKDTYTLRKQLDNAHGAMHEIMMGKDQVTLRMDGGIDKTFSKFNRRDLEKHIAHLEYELSLSERSQIFHSIGGSQ